jgi:ABC-2 type transport system permease protein
MNMVWILVERELRVRLRNRAFIVSTVVSVLLVVAVAVLPKVFGGNTSTWEIGAVGTDATDAARAAADAAPIDRQAQLVALTEQEVREALSTGDVDVVVLEDGTLVGNESVNEDLDALLQSAWRQQVLTGALVDAGVDETAAGELAAAPARPVELLDPPDDERDRRVGFLVFGVILLYGQLLGYGFAVASGVVEEKASRVVEVLLAKVRPRQLLASKVLGIGAIGLGQLLLFVGVGLLAFRLANRFEIPPGMLPSVAGLMGWFVLGFALYAAMFAVAGSLAARVEDLQSSSGPITLVVALSFIGAVTAASDPEGTLATALSFIPTTAPMVMPIRSAAGAASWWQIGVSITIVVVSGLLTMWLADLVYRRAALRTVGRSKLVQVLRAV